MNCLHIDPITLIRKIELPRDKYNYIFLEILKSYTYTYLLSLSIKY